MITNREIASEGLLDEALDEVLDSARENGFSEAELAAILRERADALDAATTEHQSESAESAESPAPDDGDSS